MARAAGSSGGGSVPLTQARQDAVKYSKTFVFSFLAVCVTVMILSAKRLPRSLCVPYEVARLN